MTSPSRRSVAGSGRSAASRFEKISAGRESVFAVMPNQVSSRGGDFGIELAHERKRVAKRRQFLRTHRSKCDAACDALDVG